MSEHTSTPWRRAELDFAMNDGAVPIMAGDGESALRIALVDCQTKPKRGEGWKTKCAVRDANLALIIGAVNAHEALVAALRQLHDNLAEYQRINNLGGYDNQDMRQARDALELAMKKG